LAEGNTLNQLRDEVDDEEAGGMAYRVPGAAAVRVFGLEDLHPWAGWAGAAPNLETLKGWLES
ncbi:MAG: hypothetical protein NZ554_13905, partial [Bryobacteraceae bacterium]|nr:hypothetical protein [Bryobacteraceae bacterium]